MKNYISRVGVSLVACALVVTPLLVVAQSALEVSIDAPADDATVTVGEDVSFSGSATGGDPTSYQFNWELGDGTEIAEQNTIHSYSTVGTKTVTLRASDLDGNSDEDNITIEVVEAEEDLQISNIRIPSAEVTQNSAVIRWTTNLPATSRVIYDTVSHSDISGESEPNFGYAFSTVTSDEDPMVTNHEVTVSGLSPDTEYFFRVISTR